MEPRGEALRRRGSSSAIGASPGGADARRYAAPRRARSARSAKLQHPRAVSSAGASGVCAARHEQVATLAHGTIPSPGRAGMSATPVMAVDRLGDVRLRTGLPCASPWTPRGSPQAAAQCSTWRAPIALSNVCVNTTSTPACAGLRRDLERARRTAERGGLQHDDVGRGPRRAGAAPLLRRHRLVRGDAHRGTRRNAARPSMSSAVQRLLDVFEPELREGLERRERLAHGSRRRSRRRAAARRSRAPRAPRARARRPSASGALRA